MLVVISLNENSQKADYCLCTYLYFIIHKSNIDLSEVSDYQFNLNQYTCVSIHMGVSASIYVYTYGCECINIRV